MVDEAEQIQSEPEAEVQPRAPETPLAPGLPKDATTGDLILELLADVRRMETRLNEIEAQLRRKRVVR